MVEFPTQWSDLKVVLCHDWLTGMRGGERVLEVLCHGFPSASIYTLIHNRSAVSETINGHDVRTSWLQRVPGVSKHYRGLLPFFPSAIERMRLPEVDLVISLSHCVAKGIRPVGRTRHLCYCFTPMRYAWTFYREYFGGSPVKAAVARPLLAALRAWDRRSSPRVDRFAAISNHVRKRIREFYGREADVVHPPVDLEKWTPGGDGRGGFDLIVSALVPYKRIDLAVRAYNRLATPLKVVGVGSESGRLRAMASPNVEFLGWQPDARLLELYRGSRLLVFPGEEDFGIVPLEAQACGRPVVAYNRGGVLETVAEGRTGVFFDAQTEESLLDGVRRGASARWDAQVIRAHAEEFGEGRFVQGLAGSIQSCLCG